MISIQENGATFSMINGKDRYIVKDGITYDIPKKIKGNNVTQIDNQIFIDGYEFKNGKFKRTLKALYHLFF